MEENRQDTKLAETDPYAYVPPSSLAQAPDSHGVMLGKLADHIVIARNDIRHGIPPAVALDNMTLRIAGETAQAAPWITGAVIKRFLDAAGVGTGA